MSIDNKTYLGDSVYAEFDGYGLVVTTENGLPDDPSNLICMEPEVVKAFVKFAKEWYNVD